MSETVREFPGKFLDVCLLRKLESRAFRLFFQDVDQVGGVKRERATRHAASALQRERRQRRIAGQRALLPDESVHEARVPRQMPDGGEAPFRRR